MCEFKVDAVSDLTFKPLIHLELTFMSGVIVVVYVCRVWLFCNAMDCSLPGSSVHAISQARMLEWVAISFSRGIFPNQGLNPCLLHCKEILNCCATGEAWVVLCVQAQSYLTPWDPMDYRPPGSSVHGIPQARILEWIAMSSSRGSFRPRDRTQISCNSCFGRQIHSPLSHVGSPWMVLYRDPVPIFCMWIFSFSWREKWEPIPVFLPREFHGQRSLSGCSPWGCKELDTTEQPTPTHSVFPTPSNDVIIFPCWIFLTTFKRHLPSCCSWYCPQMITPYASLWAFFTFLEDVCLSCASCHQ